MAKISSRARKIKQREIKAMSKIRYMMRKQFNDFQRKKIKSYTEKEMI
jgi:hypothetical protein